MKGQRTERLIQTAARFLRFPSKQLSLTQLAETYNVSKTVISDDVSIIDKALVNEGLGGINVDRGRAGGAAFVPSVSDEYRQTVLGEIITKLSEPERVLPGGLLYYSDILFDPRYAFPLGLIMASFFRDTNPDIVMTTEVKGIPFAIFTAHALGVPLSVCRFRNRASDGSAVSVHYPTKSGDVRAMYLGTKTLARGSRVLIIDDFMRGGSTASGMLLIAKEFMAEVAGIGFFMSSAEPVNKVISDYKSLLTLHAVSGEHLKLEVTL